MSQIDSGQSFLNDPSSNNSTAPGDGGILGQAFQTLGGVGNFAVNAGAQYTAIQGQAVQAAFYGKLIVFGFLLVGGILLLKKGKKI